MIKAFRSTSLASRLAFAAALALALPTVAQAADEIDAADGATIETPLAEIDPAADTPEMVEDPAPVDLVVEDPLPEVAVDPVPVDLVADPSLPDEVPVEWVIRGGEPDVMYMAYGMAGGDMDDVATKAAEAAAETALDHINAEPAAPKAP